MLLDKLPIDQLFPVLDIFRMLIVTQEACDYYLNDCTCWFLLLRRIIQTGELMICYRFTAPSSDRDWPERKQCTQGDTIDDLANRKSR